MQAHINGFIYYNESTETNETVEYVSGGNIATLKMGIAYWSYNLTEVTSAYEMLFNSIDSVTGTGEYLLATPSFRLSENDVNYGVYTVNTNLITFRGLYFSTGGSCSSSGKNVRAVVTLAPNVMLEESTVTPGTYDIKIAK